MFLWIELLVFGFAFNVDAQDSDPSLIIFGNSSKEGGTPTDQNQTNVEDPDWIQKNVDQNLEEDPDWTQKNVDQNLEEDPDGTKKNVDQYLEEDQYGSQTNVGQYPGMTDIDLDRLLEEGPKPWPEFMQHFGGKGGGGWKPADRYPRFNPVSLLQLGKPEDLSGKSSNSTIEITWKKPQSEENGPVDGYRVCLGEKSHCDKTENRIDVSNDCHYIWDKLKPYTEYNVSVWAYIKIQTNMLDGEPVSRTIRTKASKPTPVRELQVGLLTQEINAVKIKCTEPEEINGPEQKYHLYLLGGKDAIYTNESCYFEVTGLCHSTTYQFKVIFYNGEYLSDPVISSPVGTRYVVYNYENLITCFAFLITGKSLALLLLLHKIHNLIKKKSRDQDVPMQPFNRDYENYGPLSMTMDVAEQTEPLTSSQMCTSVRSPGVLRIESKMN